MLRLSARSKRSPRETLEAAEKFFGNGYGLEVRSAGPTEVRFEGGGGFVEVMVTGHPDATHCDLEILSREWDEQVREFARTVTR